MSLTLRWYDAFCFVIVAAAALGAGGIIWRRSDGGAAASRWVCCWRGLHPAWLLAGRVAAVAVMAALLACDVVDYGSLIFVYYTEYES